MALNELRRRLIRKAILWVIGTVGWLPILIIVLVVAVIATIGWLVRIVSPVLDTDPVLKALLPPQFAKVLSEASASTVDASLTGAAEFRVPEAVIGGVWMAGWHLEPRPDPRRIAELLKPEFTTRTWTLTTRETCRVCNEAGCRTVTRRWTRTETRPTRVVAYDGITEIDWRVDTVESQSGSCTVVDEVLVQDDRRFTPDNTKFRQAFEALGLVPFEEYVQLYESFYHGYTQGLEGFPSMFDPGQGVGAAPVYEGPVLPGGQWVWPVPSSRRITDRFGWRIHPITGQRQFHTGIDIAAEHGAVVVAADGGQVTYVGWAGGYGLRVEVAHRTGLASTYNHLSTALVSRGQVVSPGQLIARVGSTGRSTGPHLHFEAKQGGAFFDPMRMLGGAG